MSDCLHLGNGNADNTFVTDHTTNSANNHTVAVWVLCLFAILCLFFAKQANAAITACKQADGSVVFQDNPCAVTPKPTKKSAKVADLIPFGIDKSWFDKPPIVPDRAVCTPSGCHCGLFSRDFKRGIQVAVADALYLDGSWHRLESTLMELELADGNSFETTDLRQNRDESACNVLMSQKTLLLYGENVLAELRQKKRYAEERGLDDADKCDDGDMLVCEYTDKIDTYNRIQSDIKSLIAVKRDGTTVGSKFSAENNLD